ncbi:MAG: YlmH/Sll1252 family protein [Acholeplasmataceae bacterium]|nr:YlmH/Sll1252 family protein [Acholeplasmataceae bacterium]
MIENIIKNISSYFTLTKFLTLEEQKIIEQKCRYYVFYPLESERKRAIVSQNEITNKDFQIEILKITYNKKFGNIAHKDVLGAILGLGIKRECIGDIIISDDIYVYVIKEMSSFIVNNLITVGKVNVNVQLSSFDEIKDINIDNYVEDEMLISSYRLDTIVSERTNLSREKAKQYVILKNVKVNGNININPDYIVKINDLISIHRYGRIIINEEIRKTKKDKIIIKVLRTR